MLTLIKWALVIAVVIIAIFIYYNYIKQSKNISIINKRFKIAINTPKLQELK
jgi:hypothetical protein